MSRCPRPGSVAFLHKRKRCGQSVVDRVNVSSPGADIYLDMQNWRSDASRCQHHPNTINRERISAASLTCAFTTSSRHDWMTTDSSELDRTAPASAFHSRTDLVIFLNGNVFGYVSVCNLRSDLNLCLAVWQLFRLKRGTAVLGLLFYAHGAPAPAASGSLSTIWVHWS